MTVKKEHASSAVRYLLAACAITALTACESASVAETDAEASSATESASIDADIAMLDVSKPGRLGDIKLAEYRDLLVTIEAEDPINDDDVDYAIREILREKAEPADTVEYGDYVTLSYTSSTIDGAEKDTVESGEIMVGSETLPDGAEDSIVGMKVDESKDITVLFPETWYLSDVAGNEGILTVNIKAINRPMELTDETVSSINGNYNTVDAFKDYLKSELQKEYEYSYDNQKGYAALDAVKGLSETTPSDEAVQWAENVLIKEYYAAAVPDYYGISLGELITLNTTDLDGFRSEIEDSARQLIEDTLIIDAIADEAGITVTADDVKEYCDRIGDYEESLVGVFGREYIDLNVKEYVVLRYLKDQVVYVYADDAE